MDTTALVARLKSESAARSAHLAPYLTREPAVITARATKVRAELGDLEWWQIARIFGLIAADKGHTLIVDGLLVPVGEVGAIVDLQI